MASRPTGGKRAATLAALMVVSASGVLAATQSPQAEAAVMNSAGTLSFFAGTGTGGAPTAGVATSSNLYNPGGVAVDSSGNVYIADYSNHRVEKVTSDGALSVFAGTGTGGAPTAGAATSSMLNNPTGVAVDSSGNVYIADTNNHRVEKVTPSGTLSLFAGTGTAGAPTAGVATSSRLYSPQGVAVDSSGNVYIADTSNHRVEKVMPDGTLSVFAGTGTAGAPTAGAATSSKLGSPRGVAVDSSGNVYIADSGNHRVEKVTSGGTLSVFAGTGTSGAPTGGVATSSRLYSPSGVAVDSSGNVYIADTTNHRVEKVTTVPSAPTIGVASAATSAWWVSASVTFTAPSTDSSTSSPYQITSYTVTATDTTTPANGGQTATGTSSPIVVSGLTAGDSYTFKVTATNGNGTGAASSASSAMTAVTSNRGPGNLFFFAGSGIAGTPTAGAATSSMLKNPTGVAVDSSGNVYIADYGNHLVEKVTPDGTLSEFAGRGNAGAPAAGAATSSGLFNPAGIAVDSSDNVYIADTNNHRVEKVTPSGALSVFAGTGTAGAPTEGPATSSMLAYPTGIAVDSSGNVYIADASNNRVEKVTSDGTLSVFAGTGTAGAPADGAATSSMLNAPQGVAVDSSRNVYIADYGNHRVEKVTPSGTLSLFAGTGTSGVPTAGAATSSTLNNPYGVAVDSSGNVYIGDRSNNLVEKVTPGGTLSVFAGTGTSGAPTGGVATSSKLNNPRGIAVDSSGKVYIADSSNNLVEVVSTLPGVPTGVVATRGLASVSVVFSAPSSNSSAASGYGITGYTVTATDTTTPANGGQTATGSSSPISVSGLTVGDSYTFTVKATNANGSGANSVASAAVTTAPTTPGSFTGAPSGTSNKSSVTVGFTLGESGGTVECRLDTGAWGDCTSVSGTAGSFAVSGLSDASHTVSVRQTDSLGNVSTVGTTSWTKATMSPTAALLDSGSARVGKGSTIKGSGYSVANAYGSPSTVFAWERCTVLDDATSCGAITGASGAWWGVRDADIGYQVRLKTSWTTLESVTSVAYSALSGLIAPVSSSAPVLNFGGANTHPVKGTSVRSSFGVWAGYVGGVSTVEFQWQRCTSSSDATTCSDISSKTGQWYTPTASDTGKFLRVRATLTTRGQSVTAYSVVSGASTNTALGRRAGKRVERRDVAQAARKRSVRASRTAA